MPSLFDRLLLALSGELRHQQATLTALQAQMETIMATQEQFDERMTLLDDATNELAKDLQALRDQLATQGGIPDSVLTALDEKIAKLQKLGADPANPIPVSRMADDNIVWST